MRSWRAASSAERLRGELGVGPAPGHPGGDRAPARTRRRGRRCRRDAGSPMFGRSRRAGDAGRGLVGGADGTGPGRATSRVRRGSARRAWWANWPGGRTTRGRAWRSARASTSAARPRCSCGRSSPARSRRSVPRPPRAARLARRARQARSGPRRARWAASGTPPLVAAPELERLRIFDAVLRLVEWAAAGRPVLLVAEDVHRADRASLALSAHIGRRLAALPVLFVLTRRDRPAHADADALLADLDEPRRGGHRGRARPVVGRGGGRGGAHGRGPVGRGGRAGRSRWPTATRCWRWRAHGRRPRAGWTARAPGQPAGAGAGRARRAARATRGRSRRPSRRPGAGCPRPRSRRCRGAATTPGRHRRRRTARARLRAPAPRGRRPALPARAARRGRPRRPARPGGHAPGGRAARWRRQPRPRRRPRGRGGAPPAAGGPRRPRRTPLAAGRPARPHPRRPAGGHRVLGRSRALRPGRRRHRASSSSRCTPGRAGPRSSSARGPHARLPHPRRPRRPRGDGGGCSSRPSCATRPPPSRLTAAPRSCSAPDAPDGAAGPGARRPGVERGRHGRPDRRRTPCSRRCGSWSRRAACLQAWRTSWSPRPESARLITLIRLGRFAECEAVAEAAGAAADRLRRPDLAYVIWIQDHLRADLRRRPRGRTAHRRARGSPRPATSRWSPCPASPRGRTCWPGWAGTSEAAERGHRAAGDRGQARLAAAARRWPGTTRGWSPLPTAATVRPRTC